MNTSQKYMYKNINLFLSLLLVSTTLLGGCTPAASSSPEPNIQIEQNPRGTEAVLQENAYPLPQNVVDAISSYDSDSGEIIIPADVPGAEQIQVGQIIVGGISEQTPSGLLRRVVNIETVYTSQTADATGSVVRPQAFKQFIIHTVKATLQELFKRAQIKDSKMLKHSMLETTSGLGYDESTDSIIVFVNETLTDENNSGAKASLEGKVFINPNFDFDIRYDDGLQYAELRNETTIKSQVTLTAEASFRAGKEVSIYDLYFKPQTIVIETSLGAVPVVYRPVIHIFAGANGEFTTKITFSAEKEVSYERAYIYDGASWQEEKPNPVWSQIEYPGPELSIKFQARAYVKPNLEMVFYELVGLYTEAEFYLQLVVDPSIERWWTLSAGVNVDIGFKFEIFTDELPQHKWTVIKKEQELDHAKAPPVEEHAGPAEEPAPPPQNPPNEESQAPAPQEEPNPPAGEANPPNAPPAGTGNGNIVIIYDNTSAFVMNKSQSDVTIKGLVFNRIDNQGKITASYRADTWGNFYSGYDPVHPGYCLRIATPNSSTSPGCTIQVNYETSQEQFHFWKETLTSEQFQVLQNNTLIQTCEISAGSCAVNLP
jgi:hypothetical protein